MKHDQISELMKSERPQDWVAACELAVDNHQWARLIHLTCSTFYHAFWYEPLDPAGSPSDEEHRFAYTGLNQFLCSLEPAERAAFRKEILRQLHRPIYDPTVKMMTAGSTDWAIGVIDQLFQLTYTLSSPLKLIDPALKARIELATAIEKIRISRFMGNSIMIGRIKAWITTKYLNEDFTNPDARTYPPDTLVEAKKFVLEAFTLEGMGRIKSD